MTQIHSFNFVSFIQITVVAQEIRVTSETEYLLYYFSGIINLLLLPTPVYVFF